MVFVDFITSIRIYFDNFDKCPAFLALFLTNPYICKNKIKEVTLTNKSCEGKGKD